MRRKSEPDKAPAEQVIKDIRRAARRHFSAEDKIRIVLEACAAKTASPNSAGARASPRRNIYGWSKEFLEAGKRRLAGDTARAATPSEVKELRHEAKALKEVVADLTLENRLLKKSMTEDGDDEA
jgi:transposase